MAGAGVTGAPPPVTTRRRLRARARLARATASARARGYDAGDLLYVAGAGCVTIGAGMWSYAAGWVAAGVSFLAMAVLSEDPGEDG